MPADPPPTAAPRQPFDSPTGAHPEPVPLVSDADLVNPMLTVADVMTANPRTVSPYSTALEAVLVMRDANCGVLPVTEDGRPVGVVTDRDIALALADHTADLAITPVGQLMATDLVTIETDATLEQAIGRMGEQGLRRLLVVDAQGQLRGILSLIDLAGQISERAAGRVLARIAEYRA